MPLIHIHLIKGVRTPEEIRKLADVIYKCTRESFAAPEGDRYQVITQHEPYELICDDTGLGIKRTDRLVVIQVFQQGRDTDKKRALYSAIAEGLQKQCNTSGEDVVISLTANQKEDWSFGHGRAQFLTGEL